MSHPEQGVENCSSCGGPSYACDGSCVKGASKEERDLTSGLAGEIVGALEDDKLFYNIGRISEKMRRNGVSKDVFRLPEVQAAAQDRLFKLLKSGDTKSASEIVEVLKVPEENFKEEAIAALRLSLREGQFHLASIILDLRVFNQDELKQDEVMRSAILTALKEHKNDRKSDFHRAASSIEFLKGMVGLGDGGSEAESVQKMAA